MLNVVADKVLNGQEGKALSVDGVIERLGGKVCS